MAGKNACPTIYTYCGCVPAALALRQILDDGVPVTVFIGLSA